jgi:hypothetical protein
MPSTQKLDAQEGIRQLREFRRGITLGELSVREMIEEGRKAGRTPTRTNNDD